jgi:D-methionine transport system ATP-binding protein
MLVPMPDQRWARRSGRDGGDEDIEGETLPDLRGGLVRYMGRFAKMSTPTIQLRDVTKRHPDGTVALAGVTLEVPEGAAFGLVGPSGAGKSTLARLVKGLERPTSGAVRVLGVDLATASESERRGVQRRTGVVFQHFNLLEQRTAAENVGLPLALAGVGKDERRSRAEELLELVGLHGYGHRYPSQLSGGQKQRVGIARALVTRPALLVLDEATSALDPATARSVLELLHDLRAKAPVTLLAITHQPEVVHALCTHVAVLEQGKVVQSGTPAEVLGAEAALPRRGETAAVPS